MSEADNTYLVRKGNMDDLLFGWVQFSSFAYIEISIKFTCLVESKPAKQEISHTVILPIEE